MSVDQGIDTAPGTRGVAVVTGAASGIGRAVALRLAREQWDLAIFDVDGDGLAETEKLAQEVSGAARLGSYLVDVTDAGSGDLCAVATVAFSLSSLRPAAESGAEDSRT